MNLPDSFSITWDGQRYRPIGTHQHRKLNGDETTLIAMPAAVWSLTRTPESALIASAATP